MNWTRRNSGLHTSNGPYWICGVPGRWQVYRECGDKIKDPQPFLDWAKRVASLDNSRRRNKTALDPYLVAMKEMP